MRSFTYTIQSHLGIHARPAGQLIKLAKQFQSKIVLSRNGQEVDCRKLIALMGLNVVCGDIVEVSAEGIDEEQSIVALQDFFQKSL